MDKPGQKNAQRASGPDPSGSELIRSIPLDWREPTLEIARTLRAAGHRAWIVGGGVRDLLLGRPIKDIDLVSAALPDEIESLFERTVAVGKSFGIIVIVQGGKEIEMATFRRERGYSDRRRPDEIEYAASPEVDACRRDFTCNALYLDPLTGEIADPTGGMADLDANELRAVGCAADRFREDGLRLLRAGRFLAALGLEPTEGLLEAMAAEAESINGVSPERVLDELSKILRGPEPARALRVLHDAGVLARALVGWFEGDARDLWPVLAACLPDGELGATSPVALGLAVLLERFGEQGAVERVEALRASRTLRGEVAAVLRLAEQLRALIDAESEGGLSAGSLGAIARGERAQLFRETHLRAAATLVLAGLAGSARSAAAAVLRDLEEVSRAAPAKPFELSAQDAMAAGLTPGPQLGETLRAARLAALGGAFDDRSGALEWLRRRREA